MGAHKTAGLPDNGACVRVCDDFFVFVTLLLNIGNMKSFKYRFKSNLSRFDFAKSGHVDVTFLLLSMVGAVIVSVVMFD